MTIKCRCNKCGEVFVDIHADEIGGLAPAECSCCGEEEDLEELKK